MRKNKTSQAQRGFYRYYKANGTVEDIFVSGEVSPEDIRRLHEFDDEEFDANRRESYHVPIHYETTFELDERESFGEKSILMDDALCPLDLLVEAEKEKDRADLTWRLQEAVKSLTPKQQETIRKVFVERRSNADIAREEGVSKMAITNRLKKIYANLEKKIKK